MFFYIIFLTNTVTDAEPSFVLGCSEGFGKLIMGK